MQRVDLSVDEILTAYDQVSALYARVPALSLWRAWELAAYRRFEPLAEPVLDVGCGDGRYFRLVWPTVSDVTGVDWEPAAVDRARGSGVYRQVLQQPAQQMTLPARSFASAFANCSLEHMDDLPAVLRNIHAALKPGGGFVLSVVTDKLLEWMTLRTLLEQVGAPELAARLAGQFIGYHHYVNAYPAQRWADLLAEAGFEVLEHVPLAPEMVARVFLLIDELWHVPGPGGAGELGAALHRRLCEFPGFDAGFRQVLSGLMHMERDRSIGAGAVFRARRAS